MLQADQSNRNSSEEPTNGRLWAMFITQAKAHFSTYPCPAASHWVHQHYLDAGGTFRKTSSDYKKSTDDIRREAFDKKNDEVKDASSKREEKKKKG